jgi:transposase
MRKFREGVNREQLTFLPRSVDEYVPADDGVRFIDGVIEALNLASIEGGYKRVGAPPFSPRILVKVILYGKMRGIRSCRELSRACRENVKFMFLARGEQPDFRTINLFRRRFAVELGKLLGETVRLAHDEGMVSLEHVAIDGTKIKGYASKKSFVEPKELDEAYRREFLRDCEEETEEDDDDEPKLPPALRDRTKLKERIHKAIEHLAQLETEGKKQPKQVSLTDPECHYLHAPKETSPMYNLQAAVCAKQRIVVAGYATSAGSDNAELVPVLDEIVRNTAQAPIEVSADKGYCDYAGMVELEKRGIEGFISQKRPKSRRDGFTFDAETNSFTCSEGRKLVFVGTRYKRKIQNSTYRSENCQDCSRSDKCIERKLPGTRRMLTVSTLEPYRDRMIARMQTELGKRRSALRASVVEPLFGHLKHAKNLIRFFVRGRIMVDAGWKLELAAFNIEKIARFRMKHAKA